VYGVRSAVEPQQRWTMKVSVVRWRSRCALRCPRCGGRRRQRESAVMAAVRMGRTAFLGGVEPPVQRRLWNGLPERQTLAVDTERPVCSAKKSSSPVGEVCRSRRIWPQSTVLRLGRRRRRQKCVIGTSTGRVPRCNPSPTSSTPPRRSCSHRARLASPGPQPPMCPGLQAPTSPS
jgi:hypothetical protein